MGQDMRESAVLSRVKHGYTTGARTLASRSIGGLARTRVTPNALTTAGVSLCLAASVLVFFENRNPWLFYWAGALAFVVGSILDILDGALARAGGKTTPFGAIQPSIKPADASVATVLWLPSRRTLRIPPLVRTRNCCPSRSEPRSALFSICVDEKIGLAEPLLPTA